MSPKKCLLCNVEYSKKYNESKRSFDERKYCSSTCGNQARVGKKLAPEHKEKIRLAGLGRRHTAEAIAKMSGQNAHRWRGGKPKCIDCQNPIANLYAKRCESCYKKFARGVNAAHWQGGKTSKNMLVRNSKEMKEWRNAVFKRDGFTCLMCKQVGYSLQAHHIIPFSVAPELWFDVDNGATLCKACHHQVHRGQNGIKLPAVIKAVAA